VDFLLFKQNLQKGQMGKIEILSLITKFNRLLDGKKCENSDDNCSLNSSEMAQKIRAPHIDVQIETYCLTSDTVGAAA